MRRIESHHVAADGTRLFRRAWQPVDPHHVVVLVHGYAEHTGRYDATGAALATEGYAVESFDLRGHGRSEGVRCHVDRFGDYLDDLDAFLALVRDHYHGLPIHLLGHSMGGLIVLSHLAERHPVVSSAVVSAPPLELRVAGFQRVLGQVLHRLWPTFRMQMDLGADGLSRDPEVVRRYQEDPLVESGMTASLAAEMGRTVAATSAAGGAVEVPLLALHGDADPICPSTATRAFMAAVTSTGSRYLEYSDLRHEILNEPEQDQVRRDILAWWKELSE